MEPDEFIKQQWNLATRNWVDFVRSGKAHYREYINDQALKRMMGDARGKRILDIGCGGWLEAHWSPDCGIMQCAHERGLLACSRCPEFICPALEKFYATGYEKENALRQLEIGLEAWWKEHRIPSREFAIRKAYTEREDSN